MPIVVLGSLGLVGHSSVRMQLGYLLVPLPIRDDHFEVVYTTLTRYRVVGPDRSSLVIGLELMRAISNLETLAHDVDPFVIDIGLAPLRRQGRHCSGAIAGRSALDDIEGI